MKIRKFLAAFTLIELLVVISIIAILAGIALPVFSQVQIKGAQTKALSNAKQIGLALKIYATDNSGIFPSYQLSAGPPITSGTTLLTNSNDCFAQLFPQYLTNETIFWVAKSAECLPSQPDNVIDNPLPASPTETLKSGENHWAYVPGLNDTSNSAFPLIADCFATTAATACKYTNNVAAKGGVWSGSKAIVIRCDISGAIEKVDPTAYEVYGVTGGATQADIFATTTTWIPNSPVNPN
jgi:prepilin-type N-terminal cleavage/methylation domain-containing protein